MLEVVYLLKHSFAPETEKKRPDSGVNNTGHEPEHADVLALEKAKHVLTTNNSTQLFVKIKHHDCSDMFRLDILTHLPYLQSPHTGALSN